MLRAHAAAAALTSPAQCSRRCASAGSRWHAPLHCGTRSRPPCRAWRWPARLRLTCSGAHAVFLRQVGILHAASGPMSGCSPDRLGELGRDFALPPASSAISSDARPMAHHGQTTSETKSICQRLSVPISSARAAVRRLQPVEFGMSCVLSRITSVRRMFHRRRMVLLMAPVVAQRLGLHEGVGAEFDHALSCRADCARCTFDVVGLAFRSWFRCSSPPSTSIATPGSSMPPSL